MNGLSSDSRPLTSLGDWEHQGPSRAPILPGSDFQRYFDRHLPKRRDWTVLEIGACPGSQLLAIALSHGYTPTALDYLPEIRRMPEDFARFGIRDLEVIEQDFLTFSTARRFNVVMSFGFIEHFTEPAAIIRRHWDLVAEGGYLVLGSPSFGPLQLALRRLALKSYAWEQTTRAHNPEITSVEAISRVCRRLPGAQIEHALYVGHMGTWFTPRSAEIRRGRAWLVALWHVVGRVPRWLDWSSRGFAPLCLVITRKT